MEDVEAKLSDKKISEMVEAVVVKDEAEEK